MSTSTIKLFFDSYPSTAPYKRAGKEVLVGYYVSFCGYFKTHNTTNRNIHTGIVKLFKTKNNLILLL